MAYVKKFYVNYKDCSTQTTLVLPCILTEKGIIISHLRYLAWFNSKSEAWKERSCYALKLLLKYINTPISTLNKLFKLNRRITTFFIHNDADRM